MFIYTYIYIYISNIIKNIYQIIPKLLQIIVVALLIEAYDSYGKE